MIAPGYQLYRGTDGGWRYATPDERFVKVTGTVSLDDPALRAALTDRGVLATATAPADRPPARVRIEGDGPVADLLRDLLGGETLVDSGPAAVRVSVAGHLPDVDWLGTPPPGAEVWHRCHQEGDTLVLGPFAVPGAATYADTRGRRLAAAPAPDELLGLWAHLGTDAAAPPPAVPRPAAAVAAGLLAADVLAHLDGRPVPSLHHQLVLGLRDLGVRRHPVLPLPDLG